MTLRNTVTPGRAVTPNRKDTRVLVGCTDGLRVEISNVFLLEHKECCTRDNNLTIVASTWNLVDGLPAPVLTAIIMLGQIRLCRGVCGVGDERGLNTQHDIQQQSRSPDRVVGSGSLSPPSPHPHPTPLSQGTVCWLSMSSTLTSTG